MSRTFDFSVPLDPAVFTRLPQAASPAPVWASSWKVEGGLLKPDGNHSNNHLVVEGQTNGTVSATLVTADPGTVHALLFRGGSTLDYNLLTTDGNVIQIANGGEVTNQSTGTTFTSGDEMRVDFSGSYFSIYKNGVLVTSLYGDFSTNRYANFVGVLSSTTSGPPTTTSWDNLTVSDGFAPCDPPVTPFANCKWEPYYGVQGGSDESGAYGAPTPNYAVFNGRPHIVLTPYGPDYNGSTFDWEDVDLGWQAEASIPGTGKATTGQTNHIPGTGAWFDGTGILVASIINDAAYGTDNYPTYDHPFPNMPVTVKISNPSFGTFFGDGTAASFVTCQWWGRPIGGGPAVLVDCMDRVFYGFSNENYMLLSTMPSGYYFDHVRFYLGSCVAGPIDVPIDWYPRRHPLRPPSWPSGFPVVTRGRAFGTPWFQGWTPEANGIWRIEADDTLTRVVDFEDRILNCWGLVTAKWRINKETNPNEAHSGGNGWRLRQGAELYNLSDPTTMYFRVNNPSPGGDVIQVITVNGVEDIQYDNSGAFLDPHLQFLNDWDPTVSTIVAYYYGGSGNPHVGIGSPTMAEVLAAGYVKVFEYEYLPNGYLAWDHDQWVEVGDGRFPEAPINSFGNLTYYSGPRALDRHGEVVFFEGDGANVAFLQNSRQICWLDQSDASYTLHRADAYQPDVDINTYFNGTYANANNCNIINFWEDANGVWIAFARHTSPGTSDPIEYVFARYPSLDPDSLPNLVRRVAGPARYSLRVEGTQAFIDDDDDMFLFDLSAGFGGGQIRRISKSTGASVVEYDEATSTFIYPYLYYAVFFKWNGRMMTDNYFSLFMVRNDDGTWTFEPNNPEGPDQVPSREDFDFLRIAAVTPTKMYALCFDDEDTLNGDGTPEPHVPPLDWGFNSSLRGSLNQGVLHYYSTQQYPVFLARLGLDAPPVPSVASRKISRVEPLVWTSKPDADSTDRVYLDSLGLVKDLKYGHAFPGGSKALSGTLLVPAGYSHRALTPGRELGVTVGAEDVWHGELSLCPISDDGSRTLVGIGDMAVAGDFVALGLASHNALNPNEIVDAAGLSGRHARFRRADVYPMPPGQYAQDGSLMLDEALTQSATATGNRWRIDRDRVVRFYPLAGDGTRWLLRARHDVDRTTEGMATRISGAYVDALTGLYNVEHYDSPYELTGGTQYPDFYNAARTAYSQRNFTLYSDGVKTWAYVMQAPPTATLMYLSTGQVLDRIENSQFYSRWEGPTPASLGTGGRTANYKAVVGGPSLGTGPQNGITHRGHGSLHATEFISPKEVVVDLTGQGSFSKAEVLDQLKAALEKMQAVPHYSGGFTAAPGDLVTMGGVPCDLASVQAGCVVTVLVLDPTRNMALQADELEVLIGETEYDVETNVLTLTPYADESGKTQPPRYIDPLTGLYR